MTYIIIQIRFLFEIRDLIQTGCFFLFLFEIYLRNNLIQHVTENVSI
jgi:hypothetical protein